MELLSSLVDYSLIVIEIRFYFWDRMKWISITLNFGTFPFKHFFPLYVGGGVGNYSHDYLYPEECQIYDVALVNEHPAELP